MNTDQLTPIEFKQFQRFILELSGIDIPDNKISLLSNRIRRRLRATATSDFATYFQLLTSTKGKAEVEGFLNAVTTNETSFFRTDKHFDWLRTAFVESLVKQARNGERQRMVRIWSAACSTGEEPYSIAMSLAENRHRLANWSIEILGTDISQQAIDHARAGIYGPEITEEVPERLLMKYFTHQVAPNTWEMKPGLRAMVTTRRHNLMERNPDSGFDCIFIRNVLIYFNRESKQTVIDHLVHSLAQGGYLVVGPSEGIFDMLGMLTKRSTFLYQKC